MTESLGVIQAKGAAAAGPASQEAESAGPLPPVASRGSGAPLEAGLRGDMERSFGADFSSVRVHEDGAAEQLGARAFAQGEAIHLAPGQYNPSSQDSRGLIGHELAHVVQQRAGRVSAPQGFGGLGVNQDSALEGEADQAGERAARGEPAGMSASGGTAAAPHAPIQPKLRWDSGVAWLNASSNQPLAAKFPTLASMEHQAEQRTGNVDVEVVARQPAVGVASYSFKAQQIAVAPVPPAKAGQIASLTGDEVNDRAITLSHELQHVCDAFGPDKNDPLRAGVRTRQPWEEAIHGEWRAHATQVIAAREIAKTQGAQAVPPRHALLMTRWKPNTFDRSQAGQPQSMFSNTASYITQYSGKTSTDDEVEAFIKAHSDWKQEAFTMCPP